MHHEQRSKSTSGSLEQRLGSSHSILLPGFRASVLMPVGISAETGDFVAVSKVIIGGSVEATPRRGWFLLGVTKTRNIVQLVTHCWLLSPRGIASTRWAKLICLDYFVTKILCELE